jgi:hypothetical protein
MAAGEWSSCGLYPGDEAGGCVNDGRDRADPSFIAGAMQKELPDDIRVSFEFDQSPM